MWFDFYRCVTPIGKTTSSTATPSHLLSFLVRHLHTSSNLHEELHHSFFLYILMGHRHFIGLPEYASCLLLLVAPLFILFFTMGNLLAFSLTRRRALVSSSSFRNRIDSSGGRDTEQINTNNNAMKGDNYDAFNNVDVYTSSTVNKSGKKYVLASEKSTRCSYKHLTDGDTGVGLVTDAQALLRRATRVLLVDICSGLGVCVAGYIFLQEMLRLSAAPASVPAPAPAACEWACCLETGPEWSSLVITTVIAVYDLYQHFTFFAIQSHGQRAGIAEVWYCFTSLCCVLYGLLVLVYHAAGTSIPGGKFTKSRKVNSNNDDATSRRGKGDVDVWLHGYVVSYLLLLATLASVLAMHHSALAFFVVPSLVPLVFTHVTVCFFAVYSRSSSTTATSPAWNDSGVVREGVHRFQGCLCLFMGVIVSPPVLLSAITVLRARGITDSTTSYEFTDSAAHTDFYVTLFRLLFSFTEEVSIMVVVIIAIVEIEVEDLDFFYSRSRSVFFIINPVDMKEGSGIEKQPLFALNFFDKVMGTVSSRLFLVEVEAVVVVDEGYFMEVSLSKVFYYYRGRSSFLTCF